MDYKKKTIQAYSKTFGTYVHKRAGTENEALPLIEKFTSLLKGNKVLEIGFGLGIDAKWFIDHGYEYTGIEPVTEFSEALKEKFASATIVNQDINSTVLPKEHFDGVWAMASLLHLNNDDITQALEKCAHWLKKDGVIFISLKEGEEEIIRDDGRYFNFFTKERFMGIAKQWFELLDFVISPANKHNTGKENWLSFYLKKK